MTRQSIRFHSPRGTFIRMFGATALALASMLLIASGAPAQTAACQNHESLAKLLEDRYGERPAAAGLEASGRLIVLFATADSTSWTIAITTASGESCVIAVGEHWMEIKRPSIGGLVS